MWFHIWQLFECRAELERFVRCHSRCRKENSACSIIENDPARFLDDNTQPSDSGVSQASSLREGTVDKIHCILDIASVVQRFAAHGVGECAYIMDKDIDSGGIAIVIEISNVSSSYIELANHVVVIANGKIIKVSVKIEIDDVGLKSECWADRGKNHNHGDQKRKQ